MLFDIKKAFTFAFKENDGIKNVIIGGLVIFIGGIFANVSQFVHKSVISQHPEMALVLLISILLGFLFSLTAGGYLIKSANNYINDNCPILPSWMDIMNYFKIGILSTLIGFLYAIPFLITLIISTIVMILAKNFMLTVLIIPIEIVIGITTALFAQTAMLRFMGTLSFKEAFNFDVIKEILSLHLSDIVITFLAMIGIGILTSITMFLCIITCIGAVLVPFLMFIIQVASINIWAQVYKKIACEPQGVL